ncbi:MAG: flagellar biosynthesis anti-sigma factor FlgM [Sphingorhabdus sp.]|uniref:flagellar biosynthesis anti-sigma factor FlgM n=1 Tax=Sphingorhabdus sp. TaxID=1902408 RepID=UPI003CB50553
MTQPVSFTPLRTSHSVAQAPAARDTPVNAAENAPPVPVARLSRLANELAMQAPPVDHARIAQLRQAIASGDYRPDAQAIADAMLDHFGWAGT